MLQHNRKISSKFREHFFFKIELYSQIDCQYSISCAQKKKRKSYLLCTLLKRGGESYMKMCFINVMEKNQERQNVTWKQESKEKQQVKNFLMVMLKGISTMTIIQQDYRELLSRLKVVGRQKKIKLTKINFFDDIERRFNSW